MFVDNEDERDKKNEVVKNSKDFFVVICVLKKKVLIKMEYKIYLCFFNKFELEFLKLII